MGERQRHGDTAADDRRTQDDLQPGIAERGFAFARAAPGPALAVQAVQPFGGLQGVERRRFADEDQAHRQHDAAGDDAEPDKAVAPAGLGDRVAEDRRPHDAGQALAAGDDPDRHAAAALVPFRDICHQRRIQTALAEKSKQDEIDRKELPLGIDERGQDRPGDDRGRGDHRQHHRAQLVEQIAHQDAAHPATDKLERKRQRRHLARPAELG